MHAIILCIAAAALGSGVGWQRLPDGGMEYIIQLDPQSLESLKEGAAIQSDIPANVGDIRSYRIQVGTKQLPRDMLPAAATTPRQPSLPISPPKQPSSLEVPQTFSPSPANKPIPERQTSFADTETKVPAATAKPALPEMPAETPKPWLPLTFALVALFASLSGNVFLGWVAWESRRQWQMAMNGKSG
jgi:hypothetical protein